MNARPVVVFGGTGFLGSAVVRALAARGVPVRLAARRPEAGALAGPTERCRADVRDEAGVAAAVEDAGAVVNAVSLYVEGRGLDFAAIHVDGAERVARRARAAGAERLVHVSGIGVDADSPSAYVRARALGEARVREAFPAATVLRPSVLFGRGDSFLTTLDTVTRLPVVPLFGRGETRLQPVHVDDVARAVAVAVSDSGPAAGVFELGGGDVVSYRDILSAVLRHRGRRRPLLPVPFPVWRALARIGRALPNTPITADQIVLMEADNVVAEGVNSFGDLGIRPKGLLDSLPQCLA